MGTLIRYVPATGNVNVPDVVLNADAEAVPPTVIELPNVPLAVDENQAPPPDMYVALPPEECVMNQYGLPVVKFFDIKTFPVTSNVYPGFEVPMPTFPEPVIVQTVVYEGAGYTLPPLKTRNCKPVSAPPASI
jgi:hypothetical protein